SAVPNTLDRKDPIKSLDPSNVIGVTMRIDEGVDITRILGEEHRQVTQYAALVVIADATVAHDVVPRRLNQGHVALANVEDVNGRGHLISPCVAVEQFVRVLAVEL